MTEFVREVENSSVLLGIKGATCRLAALLFARLGPELSKWRLVGSNLLDLTLTKEMVSSHGSLCSGFLSLTQLHGVFEKITLASLPVFRVV